MKTSNLVLHCGARHVTRDQLEQMPTPDRTETWVPIPHIRLVNEVERALGNSGMRIVSEAYGVTDENKRMFGLLQVANGDNAADYGYVIGLRGSIDKSLASGLAVGSSVFVCDNLAFSSEIVFHRKHTDKILEDLPGLVDTAIGQLHSRWGEQNTRIDAYRGKELSLENAAALTLQAAEDDIFPWRAVREVFTEFKNPRHPEFKGNTVWSFFNAVTENLKPKAESKASGLWTMPARTGRLHKLCDDLAGVVIAPPAQN